MGIITVIFKAAFALAIVIWPMVLMSSAMMFSTSESRNSGSNIYFVCGILIYPIFIFALYWYLDWTFAWISGKTLFWVSLVIIPLITQAFGYNKMILNSARNIRNSGVTIRLRENLVYFDGKIIERADSTSFVSVDGNLKESLASELNVYTKDVNSVFYYGKKIQGAEPSSFEILELDYKWWSKDEVHVFFKGTLLKGLEQADLKLLDKQYAVGKDIVYFQDKKIENVELDSFEVIANHFSKDDKNIYYENKPILAEADIKTFVFFPEEKNLGRFARDKDSVYNPYRNKKHQGIDPDSFKNLDRGYFSDKSGIYVVNEPDLRKMVGVDLEKFRVTRWDKKTNSDATDGKNYYYDGLIVEQ